MVGQIASKQLPRVALATLLIAGWSVSVGCNGPRDDVKFTSIGDVGSDSVDVSTEASSTADESEAEATTNDDTQGEAGPTTTATGDGDGDAEATGDGDGDASTVGDGDGDATTTGDGDGDGDGTTNGDGDGDGDGTTSGDGDGDGDGDIGSGFYGPCTTSADCEAGEECITPGSRSVCATPCPGTCPAGRPGGTLSPSCSFLLGFPAFSQDYCGYEPCTPFSTGECPTGMSCVFVSTGLNHCAW